MSEWGPADWYVVLGGGGAVLAAILYVLTDAHMWSSWWGGFKRPPSDPELRANPYKREKP